MDGHLQLAEHTGGDDQSAGVDIGDSRHTQEKSGSVSLRSLAKSHSALQLSKLISPELLWEPGSR
jgi:hypothetical protein